MQRQCIIQWYNNKISDEENNANEIVHKYIQERSINIINLTIEVIRN